MQRQNIDACTLGRQHIVAKDMDKVLISLCLCIASSVLILSPDASIAQQSERPNILLIVADAA